MANKTEIIGVSDLGFRIGGNTVLDTLCLSIRETEFVSILGPSGCGKTTLLRILCGLENATSGEVKFRKPRMNVAMAFQKFPLFPWLSLIENLVICMNGIGVSKREKRIIATDYLRNAHLERFKDFYPAQISGGMQQKVNIIRAFCSGADVILMDEPFVFLDFLQRNELQQFTLDFAYKEKKSVIFVTHDITEAILMSDRVLLMSWNPGQIVNEFTIDLPRPRDVDQAREYGRFQALFREIRASLNGEILKSRAAA